MIKKVDKCRHFHDLWFRGTGFPIQDGEGAYLEESGKLLPNALNAISNAFRARFSIGIDP